MRREEAEKKVLDAVEEQARQPPGTVALSKVANITAVLAILVEFLHMAAYVLCGRRVGCTCRLHMPLPTLLWDAGRYPLQHDPYEMDVPTASSPPPAETEFFGPDLFKVRGRPNDAQRTDTVTHHVVPHPRAGGVSVRHRRQGSRDNVGRSGGGGYPRCHCRHTVLRGDARLWVEAGQSGGLQASQPRVVQGRT